MVEIRPERADHPQVSALLAALDVHLRSLYPPEANHILSVEELLAPSITLMAAWRGVVAVGCGAVRRVDDDGEGAYGEVKRMYVDPASRGERIGERMLERLEASLMAAGLPRALLETGHHQHPAIRLYERCGYRRRAPFGGYPDNGMSLFYEKRL